ncbi:hypothetical protein CSB37_03775 [bacterium DOLZORAL124_38_8]|nr:MAG: hypothetical protein CSB37_03775 [bacterium DOLZORAL124_38_8]
MITEAQIIASQKQWGDGIVKIGSLRDHPKKYKAFTLAFLDELYAFEDGPILFKPTRCSVEQFRPTKLTALSYFIGGPERACAEDQGFISNPWTKVRFENANLILEEDRALAMGNYFFTDATGTETKIEYTFGYKLLNGKLKINLHHSSFPFNPK